MPPGWTTQSTEGADWQVSSGTDPCGEWDGNLTGGAGSFGLIQTSCEHVVADAQLRTPVINLAGSTSPRIEWHNDYRDLGSIADVDVSIDAGATWTNVWHRAGVDERGPGLQSVDMSDLAAGQPAVEARFHYAAFFGWWWQVDDVFIGDAGASCHAVPGGLVHQPGNLPEACEYLPVARVAVREPLVRGRVPVDRRPRRRVADGDRVAAEAARADDPGRDRSVGREGIGDRVRRARRAGQRRKAARQRDRGAPGVAPARANLTVSPGSQTPLPGPSSSSARAPG